MTTIKTLTPEETYDAVLKDDGTTPADELAKSLGYKTRQAMTNAVTAHIIEVQNQTGEMLRFPKFNVPVLQPKKPTEFTYSRSNEDAKLQLGPSKLRELGGFEKVSSFKVEAVDGKLVLTPLGWFGGAAPTSNPSTSGQESQSEKPAVSSSTPAAGSPSSSLLKDNDSETAIEAVVEIKTPEEKLATPIPTTTAPLVSEIPQVKTPAAEAKANTPDYSGLGDDDEVPTHSTVDGRLLTEDEREFIRLNPGALL